VQDWKNATYYALNYDLSHLNSFIYEFEQSAAKDNPARRYVVVIRFSHHCFTEGKKVEDDPLLEFLDSSPKRDHRTFNATRWELSKSLPEIVKSLMGRHISHTNHNSFFTVEIVLQNGDRVDYEVYFEVARVKGKLNLVVTSAFSRDPDRLGARPQGSKIRFSTILFNVLHNKPIKSGR
jgi:hypothetical protein